MCVRCRSRVPGLCNTVRFAISRHPIFNPLSEFPMPTSRRNIIIRSVASIAGDIAIGVAESREQIGGEQHVGRVLCACSQHGAGAAGGGDVREDHRREADRGQGAGVVEVAHELRAGAGTVGDPQLDASV